MELVKDDHYRKLDVILVSSYRSKNGQNLNLHVFFGCTMLFVDYDNLSILDSRHKTATVT